MVKEKTKPGMGLKKQKAVKQKVLSEDIKKPGVRDYKELVSLGVFRSRNEQEELVSKIEETLIKGGVSFLESPTGTGKTLAYILAACRFCALTGKKVVIATTTKQLQRQALKEFDRLCSDFPSISIALLKGRDNYISQQKLTYLIEDSNASVKKGLSDTLDKLNRECAACFGDAEMLSQALVDELYNTYQIDVEDLKIDNSKDDLSWYNQAKIRAFSSDICITNQAGLLMHSMHSGVHGKTMPFSTSHLIIDEAHNLENIAISCSSKSVALRPFKWHLSDLIVKIPADKQSGIKLKKDMITLVAKITLLLDRLKEEADKDDRNFISLNSSFNKDPLQSLGSKTVLQMSALLAGLSRRLQNAGKNAGQNKKAKAFRNSVNLVLKNFTSLTEIAKSLGEDTQGKYCYLLRFSDIEKYPSINMLTPMPFTSYTSRLWHSYDSITLLSGTLADSDGGFNTIKGKFNLSNKIKGRKAVYSEEFKKELKPIRGIGVRWEKVFKGHDFKKQVTAYVYPDLPRFTNGGKDRDSSKATKDYVVAYLSVLKNIIKNAKSGVLVLTPSHAEANSIHEKLGGTLYGKTIDAKATHGTNNLHGRIEAFKKHKGTLITASAWEGVDIPGTISDLVLTRVPQKSYDDPVLAAKKEYLVERGKDKGMINAVTEKARHWDMYVKFRQGTGRLCRDEKDSGNIHVLDSRIPNEPRYQELYSFLNRKFTLKQVKLKK